MGPYPIIANSITDILFTFASTIEYDILEVIVRKGLINNRNQDNYFNSVYFSQISLSR